MIQLDFTSNPNGKLFQDVFIDIRLASQAFTEGTPVQIVFKGIVLGDVIIEEVSQVSFSGISKTIALINCGRSVAYQHTLLSRYYNQGKPIVFSQFNILVLRWTYRRPAQTELITEWWNSKTYSTT